MNFSTKISNTAFPLSCCLESLIIYKKPILISFCGKVLPGFKSKNDNSPQTRSTKYSEDSSDLLEYQATIHNAGVWFSE